MSSQPPLSPLRCVRTWRIAQAARGASSRSATGPSHGLYSSAEKDHARPPITCCPRASWSAGFHFHFLSNLHGPHRVLLRVHGTPTPLCLCIRVPASGREECDLQPRPCARGTWTWRRSRENVLSRGRCVCSSSDSAHRNLSRRSRA
jgi:hypothetical protein